MFPCNFIVYHISLWFYHNTDIGAAIESGHNLVSCLKSLVQRTHAAVGTLCSVITPLNPAFQPHLQQVGYFGKGSCLCNTASHFQELQKPKRCCKSPYRWWWGGGGIRWIVTVAILRVRWWCSCKRRKPTSQPWRTVLNRRSSILTQSWPRGSTSVWGRISHLDIYYQSQFFSETISGFFDQFIHIATQPVSTYRGTWINLSSDFFFFSRINLFSLTNLLFIHIIHSIANRFNLTPKPNLTFR